MAHDTSGEDGSPGGSLDGLLGGERPGKIGGVGEQSPLAGEPEPGVGLDRAAVPAKRLAAPPDEGNVEPERPGGRGHRQEPSAASSHSGEIASGSGSSVPSGSAVVTVRFRLAVRDPVTVVTNRAFKSVFLTGGSGVGGDRSPAGSRVGLVVGVMEEPHGGAVDRFEADPSVPVVVDEVGHQAVVVNRHRVVGDPTDRADRRRVLGDVHGRGKPSVNKNGRTDSPKPRRPVP